MAIQLFSTATDLPWQLTYLKMVHVCAFDGKEFYTPKTLGYYRQPNDDDFPMDLNKGFDEFTPYSLSFYSELRCLNYIMQLPEPERQLGQLDFCTNRGSLLKVMSSKQLKLVAIKFRGCIYLNADAVPDNDIKKQYTYLFKLRQYLIVDQPGDMPNTDRAVDQNKQSYGTFTAKLGKFRLLYTSEIHGVENTEPLGDLNDPEVLKQCRLTSIRVYPVHVDWRRNYRMKRWLLSAHMVGIDQIKLAACNYKGLVTKPIVTENLADLIKDQSWCLSECMQTLHLFLSEISQVMANTDCPYTNFIFNVKDNNVNYECQVGKNSFLSKEYIDFVLRL